MINVIVLLSYMLYIRILEQNEILRLRHVLVLLSLTDSVNVCVTADRKWYIYRKLSTPCPGVSAIKRLSLYEFAPKGRVFVSVVRSREGPYYRGVFERKCMRILSEHRKLSVIERCAHREVRLY